MTETPDSPEQRRLRPTLAFLAGFVGLGLGYFYVGRPRSALVSIAILCVVLATLSASRLVVVPFGYYAFIASFVAWILAITIHPALIARARRRAPRRWYNRWWVYVPIALAPGIAVSLAGGIGVARSAAFGFDTFRTPTASMSPTLEADDYFVVDAWIYRHVAPAVGDVVVLTFPQNPAVRYVKRIVALPGDELEIRDAVVYRNGTPLHECYVHAPADRHPYGRDLPPLRLGPDEYYVLGDFRDNSRDSREYGPVARAAILGPVKFVWLSFSPHDGWNGQCPRGIGEVRGRG